MSRAALMRKTETAAPKAKVPTGAALQIGEVNDAYEQEADRVAEAVMNGRASPAWTFSKVNPGKIQRQGDQPSPNPKKYKDAAGKLEQAFLKTDIGKKLTDAASNDPLVKDADRVADQVMTMSPNDEVSHAPLRIQRLTGHASGGAGTAPASVELVLSRLGRPLEPALRQDMEQRFGYDFSNVRVHTGEEAEKSTRDVNAHAYTVGHNIVFGVRQFTPSTLVGRRLIAHELTHTIQQSATRISGTVDGRRIPISSCAPFAVLRQNEGSTVASTTYSEIKELAYKSLVDAAVMARTSAVGALRTQAMKLPESLRPIAFALIQDFNDGLQIAFNFLFYILGVIVGLGEGIFDLIKGVLQLIYGLIKFVLDALVGSLGKKDLLEEDLRAVKSFLDNFWPGLKKLFDDWTTKFSNAPQERQLAMIGELVGQVLAFIVTWEASSSKLSKLSPIKVPVPVFANFAQASELAPFGGEMLWGEKTLVMAKLGTNVGAAGLVTAQTVAVGMKGQKASQAGGGSTIGKGQKGGEVSKDVGSAVQDVKVPEKHIDVPHETEVEAKHVEDTPAKKPDTDSSSVKEKGETDKGPPEQKKTPELLRQKIENQKKKIEAIKTRLEEIEARKKQLNNFGKGASPEERAKQIKEFSELDKEWYQKKYTDLVNEKSALENLGTELKDVQTSFYEKVRKKVDNDTAYDNFRADAKKQGIDAVSGKKLAYPDDLTVDHLVPVNEIAKFPGAEKLDPKEVANILNQRDNLVPMKGPANFSKGNRKWSEWDGWKKYYGKNPSIREGMIARENTMRERMISQIQELLRGK